MAKYWNRFFAATPFRFGKDTKQTKRVWFDFSGGRPNFRIMSTIAQESSHTQESVVNLTASAARQIAEMLSKEEATPAKYLRVFVEAGGCSGMQYGMVFDERRDDDQITELHGVGVIVDGISANYLRGSTIDFSDELNGGGFKINNPNAHSSCGCGKSFSA